MGGGGRGIVVDFLLFLAKIKEVSKAWAFYRGKRIVRSEIILLYDTKLMQVLLFNGF